MGSANTYTKLAEIIEKVQRDNDYGHDLDWMDAVEWAGECLDLLKVPKTYTPLTSCITIEDYRGELPCDFHQVVQVKDNKWNIPMTVSLDNFFPEYYSGRCPDVNSSSVDEDTFHTGTFQGTEEFDSKLITHDPQNTSNEDEYAPESRQYYIKGQWIFTTFKSGEVLMSYLAFPVDENNIPLIPSDESYKQAVKHYIQERMDWKLMRQKKISPDTWKASSQDRDFYMGQAEAAGQMPTIDELESWKNDWLRLIPKIDHHRTGFDSQSMPEQRYTHNSYRGYGFRYK